MSDEPRPEEAVPGPATAAGREAADDPTRQRPLDAGGAEANTAEWVPAGLEQAHGEAIAHTAADHVAEREADEAQQEADAAHEQIEKLSRKERKAREKAEKERAKAEAEREKADEASRRETGDALTAAAEADVAEATGATTTSTSSLVSPGAGSESSPRAQAAAAHEPAAPAPAAPAPSTPADEKPEVAVAAAFAGAFVFAKLLKRVTRG